MIDMDDPIGKRAISMPPTPCLLNFLNFRCSFLFATLKIHFFFWYESGFKIDCVALSMFCFKNAYGFFKIKADKQEVMPYVQN